ncbi:MAG: type II CRISPR RNA-guided endonuclease Cas9, partial [Clostridiales bacterium]|nr:type II CRISPR RNA-guided endonuclease Cas9 [Clostridiales bacterium]
DFPSGFGHLSVKAINKILPHWTPGLTYDKACEKAEYDFKAEGEKIRVKKLELIKHAENDGKSPISNPIVRRSTSQTIKVVNALIQQYTSPIAINIELAREMAKSADERKRIANEQSENRNNNEGIKNYIKKDLNKSQPGGIDIQKVKLFREQRGLCMYSGVHIKEEDLLKDGYVEIDHIVPYSVSFNDSYKNKVLVLAAENQQKGNRLPLEYLDGQKKEQFICNVNRIYERNFEKKARLLKLEITQEDRQNFIDRNLNDTRYATKLIANMFKKYLQFSDAPNFKDDDGANRSRVLSVNGTMTSFIRSRFGFNKIREAGDTHHALDAIVVGCTTQSYISQISRHYKKLENGQRKHDMEAGKFIDFGTGEVLEHQEYIQRGLDKRQVSHKLKKDLDKQHFDSEFSPLKNVNATIFRENVENLITKSQGLHDCAEDKIFVSRKPTRKVSGQAHKDTVYGKVKVENHNGKFDSTKRFKTTKLQALKLNKNKDKIEGYSDTIFAKSDQILHKALIDKLIEYNGDAEKAFKKPFFKPIIDKKGNKIEDGNLVKSVKCIESTNLNLELRGGLAANGDMIRIDVFKIGDKLTPDNDAVKKDLGYYFVPIYVYDTVKKELPNKAVVAKKPYEEWKEMKETDFLFSLYPNDLVYMENKGKKGHFYYNGADISSGTIGLLSHDRSQLKSDGKDWDGRIGLKTLQTIKKCEVDVLGKITSIKAKQVRQTFDKKSSLV